MISNETNTKCPFIQNETNSFERLNSNHFKSYSRHWVWHWVSEMALPGFNTLRPRQNGRHFAYVIFKCIFVNENVWILIEISLKPVPKAPINNIPALVQIMAWRRPSDKPLSEPIMICLPTHICVTWPQWVNVKRGDLYQCFNSNTNVWQRLTYNGVILRLTSSLPVLAKILTQTKWFINHAVFALSAV